MKVTIHAEPDIDWQRRRASDFCIGLRRLGIEFEVSRSRTRINDNPAILFGTTFWTLIEKSGDWMLVDRASFGDPEYVQLVWNGHGRRGDHKVPSDFTSARWEAHGIELAPWRQYKGLKVLCGQTRAYSPITLEEWYAKRSLDCDVFRPHPAGDNPTGLPTHKSFDDVGMFVTLNSSFAIEALIHGYPIAVDDDGAMAQECPGEHLFPWLAWTQWSWAEIREGAPIRHLFDGIDQGIQTAG